MDKQDEEKLNAIGATLNMSDEEARKERVKLGLVDREEDAKDPKVEEVVRLSFVSMEELKATRSRAASAGDQAEATANAHYRQKVIRLIDEWRKVLIKQFGNGTPMADGAARACDAIRDEIDIDNDGWSQATKPGLWAARQRQEQRVKDAAAEVPATDPGGTVDPTIPAEPGNGNGKEK